MFKRILLSFLPILFISFLAFFYFWPNIYGGLVTYPPDDAIDDLTELHYPLRHFLQQKIHSFKLPLWTDKTYTGFPLAAQGEMGAFYPPNLVFAYLLPTHYSIYANLIFAIIFVGISLYYYLKIIGLSRYSSLFSSIIFSFTGFFLAHQTHLNHIATAMWLPMSLILIEKFLSKQKILYMLLLGLVFALGQLAGGNQILFYMIIFSLAYSAFLKPQKINWKTLAFGWLITGVFTLGLAAIQISITYELVNASTRSGGVNPTAATFLSFPFQYVLNFFLPYFFHREGSNTGWFFFERYVYFGLIPWILAGLAVFTVLKNKNKFLDRKLKYLIFWGLTAFLSLVFAFGHQTFLKFLFTLPGFNFFRIPSKFLIFTQFSVICIAGFGLETLIPVIKNKLKGNKTLITLFFYSFILFCFADIYLNDRIHVKYPADQWFSEPEISSFIKSKNTNNRIVWTGMTPYMNKIRRQQRHLYANPKVYINLHNLLPNLNNLFWDLPTSSGYSGGMGITETDYINNFLIWLDDQINEPEPIKLTDRFINLARLTNSQYLLTTKDVKHPEINQIYETYFDTGQDNVRIYEFNNPLPRAFLVDQAQTITDHQKVFPYMLKDDFNPGKEVIIEKQLPKDFLNDTAKLQAKAEIIKSEDENVMLQVETNKNALLFISDTYYPGWQVDIDGQKTDILRADFAFRAVPVEKGKHQVVFRYQPQSFRYGSFISLGFGLAFVFSFGALLLIEKK